MRIQSQTWFRALTGLTSMSLMLVSCGPEKITKKTGAVRTAVNFPTGTTVETTTVRGGVRATLDPNSKEAQLISITSGSLQGVSVAFPVGSLSIPMTISVTPGAAVSGASILGNLGVSNNAVTASGTPVEITADVGRDLLNPMVLALPLPRAASLVGSSISRGNLAVLYRIKMSESADAGSYTGLVPASALGWANESVLFESKYFGWFSVVELETPVTAAIQVKRRDADNISAKRFGTYAELPACTTADIDRLAYVAAEDKLYYCADTGKWVVIVETTPDPFDPSGLATPLQLIDVNGDVVGRLAGTDSYGRWMLLVTDNDTGDLYLVKLDLDLLDPANAIAASDIWEPSTFGDIAATSGSGAPCTLGGTAYLMEESGSKFAKLLFYISAQIGSTTNTSSTGLYQASDATANFGTIYYGTATCTSTSGDAFALGSPTTFASSIFPIAAGWSVE